MLTGVAVGGVFPLVFSLLGDLFPATRRAAMASVVQIAMGFGIGGGQLISGILGPATNWRVPFVLVAAPSLVLALVMVLVTKEPPRCAPPRRWAAACVPRRAATGTRGRGGCAPSAARRGAR